ncbi:UPF0182 family protein [Candidatus Marinamargulisbacteria bacterium SCGC AG-410-N11]|nr:UPF0182 family protein [Candidatus Marinamargulisbacteria bacterium SCGC AG-410-N11]
MTKKRVFLSVALFILFLVTSFIIKTLYPDLLWFASFNVESIWWVSIKAQWTMFLIGFLIAFLVLGSNYFVTMKIAKKISNDDGEPIQTRFEFVNQFIRQLFQQKTTTTLPQKAYNILLFLGVIIISIFFALVAKGNWENIYLFLNKVSYGTSDPLFNKDISFYFFNLPMYSLALNWIQFLGVVCLGSSIWIYMTKNLFKVLFSKSKNSKNIKTHVLVLLSFIFLLTGLTQWLSIYDILYMDTGAVVGAGYSDFYAYLPMKKIFAIALIFQSLLFFIWAFYSSTQIPFYFLGILVLIYILGLKVYPGLIQSYYVKTNEQVREQPFIENSIKFTKLGYNLDKIVEEQFPVKNNLTIQDIQKNKDTINNIRLWNKEPLKQTFSQLQEIRLYYEFFNIDVDRYEINNSTQQVMLSPRELDINDLPPRAKTWENKHLFYTHGYGVCVSPVNEISKEGLPKFFIKDIPPKSNNFDIKVTRPEIYFGEITNEYAIVNTDKYEFDYPKGDENVTVQYQGKGGIKLDSLFKKLVFSWKFGDFKILISPYIKNKSKVMYDRTIREIVNKITPFLHFDADPYLTITNEGRLVWFLDGYTISSKFPYSEKYNQYVNYIRNSVKVTVDAYNGEVNYYIMDKKDPIINAYAKLYPGLFQDFKGMPLDLKKHIRYPRDMFLIQAKMFRTYHMTDPSVFYSREDLWEVPKETYEESEQPMDPYYMVTKLPGDKKESFLIFLPFTPTNKNNMISWLSVKCNLDEYGSMKVFKFPKEKTIYGPRQIEARIDQDPEISPKLTLWGQSGSKVIRGNLMVVPIKDSLIYVEPIYIQATQSKFPELKRVIFSYEETISMQENLPKAINEKFEGAESVVNNLEESISNNLNTTYEKMIANFKNLEYILGITKGNLDKINSKINELKKLMQKPNQIKE